MTKVFVKEVSQTDCMYGYSAVIFYMTEDNIAELRKLKETFNEVKKVDANISSLTYYTPSIGIDMFNDNFDYSEDGVFEFSDDEMDEYSEYSENEYKVDSPFIRVSASDISIIYPSKHTIDEAYCHIGFGEILGE